MKLPERFTTNTGSFANYWDNGIGYQLLKKLDKKPDISDAEQLAPLLYEFDEIADQIIQDIYLPQGFKIGHQFLESYLNENTSASEIENQYLHTLFSQIQNEPEWLNKDLLEQGSALCRRAGASSLIVLRDYCLMGGYESAAINKPLIFTGALKKGAVKRLAETLEFWVDISGDKALQQGNTGFKSIIKTRLIHAYSRVNILKHTNWESEKWGIPLNQWDMLATNLGFSLVYLVGLRKIGFAPTDKEVEGLFHFWKYIGYLLGIPEKLLPDTEEEAIQALYYWTLTQSPADEDSIALAHALTAEPFLVHFPKYRISKIILQQSHLAYNYYFLGEVSCQSLHLPRSFYGPLVRLSVLINRIKERNIKNGADYKKMVDKGRKEQEKIRYIYSHINAKKPANT